MSNKRHATSPDGVVRTMGMGYPDGFVLEAHAHAWSQLLYASAGVMIVETTAGSWVVPPHRGVWLAAGASHRVTMRGDVKMQTAYFDRSTTTPLTETCVIEVSPLLRELLVYSAARGRLDPRVPHEGRLAGLLLDLVAEVKTMPLALPLPRDARALRAARAVLDDPGSEAGGGELARAAGASPRTLERLFASETGMTFGRWRQQARLLAALTLLAGGAPVTQVAFDVGYGSPSAFIAMFRSVLGTTPSRFFAGAPARSRA